MLQNTRQYFYTTSESSASGYTKTEIQNLHYDSETNIYTGEVSVTIGHYSGDPEFEVAQDPEVISTITVRLLTTDWEIATDTEVSFRLMKYPRSTINRPATKTVTLS